MTSHAGRDTQPASWRSFDGPTPQVDERLDWVGFLARFYPHARKHDYVPLAAYIEYRDGLAPAVAAPRTDRPPERRRP